MNKDIHILFGLRIKELRDVYKRQVLDSLSKKGRVYLVGGIVRDMVMYQKAVSYTHLGGSSREFSAMGETLTEQRRVKEEVIRYVNFCHRGRTVDIAVSYTHLDVYKRQPMHDRIGRKLHREKLLKQLDDHSYP